MKVYQDTTSTASDHPVTEGELRRGWADFACYEIHYLSEDNIFYLADDESRPS